jgi:hypothetical protein
MSVPARHAYLDGKLAGVRPDGTTSFSLVQSASDAGNAIALVFFLFDLLHLDGEAIGLKPPEVRKERLRTLLSQALSPLQYSDYQGRVRRGFLRACLRPEAGRDTFEAGRCAVRARQLRPVAQGQMPEPGGVRGIGWTDPKARGRFSARCCSATTMSTEGSPMPAGSAPESTRQSSRGHGGGRNRW